MLTEMREKMAMMGLGHEDLSDPGAAVFYFCHLCVLPLVRVQYMCKSFILSLSAPVYCCTYCCTAIRRTQPQDGQAH